MTNLCSDRFLRPTGFLSAEYVRDGASIEAFFPLKFGNGPIALADRAIHVVFDLGGRSHG